MTHSDIPHGQQPCLQMGSLLLLTDPDDLLVLVQPRYTEGLTLVGGSRHEGEAPRAAACRESGEDLGIEVFPGHLLLTYYSPPSPKSGAEERLTHVYDGGTLTTAQLDSITLPETRKLLDWDRVPEPRLDHFCTKPHALIIRMALEARRRKTQYDMEFTSPISEGRASAHLFNGDEAESPASTTGRPPRPGGPLPV
ncbi:NUDIX domain-containing protein [Streptomyces sp. NPDC045369]|uniref:NUDIX domain-containing protein n=1 Tax=Streptomyces sp. NPDC045369 TaxID=3155732 RepID=UPI0033F9D869